MWYAKVSCYSLQILSMVDDADVGDDDDDE